MKLTNRVLGTLLGVLSFSMIATTARASAISLTPNPGNVFNNGSGFSLGYEFSLSQAVLVTDLGYFSDTTLAESHNVGIYDTSGTLLVSATVTNANPFANFFRYASISPFSLSAGTYFIAGSSGFTDAYTFTPTTFSTDSRVTFLGSEYASGNSLQFPTTADSSVGYFGPNFNLTDASTPVPEPASMLLLGTGLSIARFVKKRRA